MSAVSALVVGFMIQQYRYQLMMIIGGTWSKVDEEGFEDFGLSPRRGCNFYEAKKHSPPLIFECAALFK
jgi:hypothetical protein